MVLRFAASQIIDPGRASVTSGWHGGRFIAELTCCTVIRAAWGVKVLSLADELEK